MTDITFTLMHSGQPNAPQMTGAAGSEGQMLQLLDNCLIDGFNQQTASSASQADGVVTISFGTSHGFIERQRIIVSGATDTALNGNHRVLKVLGSDIVIDAVGVTVLTGAIKVKVAPLGWESVFGNTNPLKRAYRSANAASTQTVLYLDMSLPAGHGYNATNPAKRAMVSICEDMTTLGVQINSYTDTVNDYAKNPNGSLFWYQAKLSSKTSSVTSTINATWVVVGNSDYFYFLTDWDASSNRGLGYRDLFGFGDVPSFAGASDSHNCMWMGSVNPNDSSSLAYATNGCKFGSSADTIADIQGFFISNHAGVGGIRNFVMTPDCRPSTTKSFSGYSPSRTVLFPNPASQSIVGMTLYAMTSDSIRASMPRLLYVPQHINNSSNTGYDLQRYENLLLVSASIVGGNAAYGYFCLDLED